MPLSRLPRRSVVSLLLRSAVVITLACAAIACSDSARTPAAERGRQVYLAQCIQCHSPDPAQAGPIGPPVKGATRELLEAKVLRGGYPPGYRPKRSTAIMPVQTAVAPEIPALAAFLNNAERR